MIKFQSASLTRNIAKFSKTLLYVERLWTANNVFHFWSVEKLLVWCIHFNFQQIDWIVSQSSCLMWQQNSTTVKYSSVFPSVNKILLFQTKFHEKVLPIFMLLRYIKIQATFQQILSFLFSFHFPKKLTILVTCETSKINKHKFRVKITSSRVFISLIYQITRYPSSA